VAQWQRLSEAQITELFDPPAQRRELIRHFTLTAADLAAILRCLGDSNRLGYGLMLCYLNYPGRALRAGERPPTELIDFVVEQLGVLPNSIDEYLAAKQNCWFILNLCCGAAYPGNIRARSSSGPARPYIARLRVLRRLICPSVCPLLHGSIIAFLTASISLRTARANRCIA